MTHIAQDENTGNARNRLAAGASAETRMRTMTDQQQLEALGAARWGTATPAGSFHHDGKSFTFNFFKLNAKSFNNNAKL